MSRIELPATIRSPLGAQGGRVHLTALVDSAPSTLLAQAIIIVDIGTRCLLARGGSARTGSR